MNDVGVLAAVAAAGGVGSALRYLVDRAAIVRFGPRFPWGTTLVNLTGSFALGMLTGLAALPDEGMAVLGTGLVGGYTTFSAASLETVRLLVDRRPATAVLASAGTLVVGVAAALAGIAVTQS